MCRRTVQESAISIHPQPFTPSPTPSTQIQVILHVLDEAGSLDNRAAAIEMWTQFMKTAKYSLLKGIQRTVVVVDFGSVMGSSAMVCRLAKAIAETIGKGEASVPFYQSMVFVFNRTGEKTRTKLRRFKKLKRSEEKLLCNKKSMLMSAAQVLLSKRDMEKVATHMASLKLAEAILECPILVSDPASQRRRSVCKGTF